ncbi:holo-ACP synthase [Rhodococcus triatomae]|uniref:Holo-[acyl-carrier-protein] synthase n=1 Tax=Rhodococcus triatomae TaxID=300028 RepID=A0A1G8E0D0_9NOCA|nr:holo-ACP synthase [Rhodococcus triatomae]QNG18307.1 holo-ACP synthase [Rhodococcus triatomae]QNG22023.1 holo-ACP synthase [Rhodococcus triatomae]SDH63315.1 holo-[acyl-carrier protein] synthase [Rhodococcus triatomae]
MAVRGVGIDLVTVSEFAEQLRRPGTAVLGNFTPGERRDCASRSSEPARHYAARWAAKEALIKAWSAALFASPPVLPETIHPLIEVVTDAWGRPRLRLHGEVAEHLAGMTVHVSLTHDGDTAAAFVVLEGD